MTFSVIFSCPWANYFWEVKGELTLEEAEILAENKNKYDHIHKDNGCCRYYAQREF